VPTELRADIAEILEHYPDDGGDTPMAEAMCRAVLGVETLLTNEKTCELNLEKRLREAGLEFRFAPSDYAAPQKRRDDSVVDEVLVGHFCVVPKRFGSTTRIFEPSAMRRVQWSSIMVLISSICSCDK
jgi:hypothetical protein